MHLFVICQQVPAGPITMTTSEPPRKEVISRGPVSSWVPQAQLNLLGAPGLAWG